MSCTFGKTNQPRYLQKMKSVHLGTVEVPYLLESIVSGITIKVIDGKKLNINKDVKYNVNSFRFAPSTIASNGSPAIDIYFNTVEFVQYLDTIGNARELLNTDLLVSLWNYEGYDNAFSNGSYLIYGSGKQLKPMVCPDIVAHEISHMITSNINGLEYKGISGALNESFSDCLSASYEFYLYKKYPKLKGKPDHDVGEDVVRSGSYVRTMREPRKMNDDKFVDPLNLTIDHGGVHLNSAIFNYLFYKTVIDIGLEHQDEFTKNWIEIFRFLPKNCDADTFGKICLENIKYKFYHILNYNLEFVGIKISK